jgi:hypothetical protein
VGQFPAREGGDALIHYGVRARQSQFESAGDLLLPLGGGEFGLALDRVTRLRPAEIALIGSAAEFALIGSAAEFALIGSAEVIV